MGRINGRSQRMQVRSSSLALERINRELRKALSSGDFDEVVSLAAVVAGHVDNMVGSAALLLEWDESRMGRAGR